MRRRYNEIPEQKKRKLKKYFSHNCVLRKKYHSNFIGSESSKSDEKGN